MSGKRHTVTVNNKTIVVVADPHLEAVPDDVAQMIGFVESLNPAAHILVFLGDIFHVWTAARQYHSPGQKRLMDSLHTFRSKGGATFLTVGNRDLFFKDRDSAPDKNSLPFDGVSRDYICLDTGRGMVMAHHGDTVNSDDKAYLRWRKFIRSGWAEMIFRLIPVGKRKFIASLETKIKKTNQQFRIHFPHDNWSKFVSGHDAQHAPGLLLVGHFHPETPIITRQGETTGIVVPSWHPSRAYLEIDTQLGYQVKQFNPKS